MNQSNVSGSKKSSLSPNALTQIKQDAKNSLKESKELWGGRAITWFAGSTIREKINNYVKSWKYPSYADEVRNEFFRQIQEQIKISEDVTLTNEVLQMTENVSNEDLPIERKNELIAQMYEKNYSEGVPESVGVYKDAISDLKKAAVQAMDEMAVASVTTSENKEKVKYELDNLKIPFKDEKQYAKEVVKILIERYGNNVNSLIKLANNIDMLFEVVGVQRTFGDEVKQEMRELILIKMGGLMKLNLNDDIVHNYYTRLLVGSTFPAAAEKAKQFQGALSEYFQAVIVEEIRAQCKGDKRIEELKSALDKVKTEVDTILKDSSIALSEDEKKKLIGDMSNLMKRIFDDKSKFRPINWLYNYEKHREHSDVLNEQLESILTVRAAAKKILQVDIDGNTINLSEQFMLDYNRIGFYIITDGNRRLLVDGEFTQEEVIRSFLEFLGYVKSNDLTEEQIEHNKNAIKILEKLSLTCNQLIGIANTNSWEIDPLRLNDGQSCTIPERVTTSNLILERTEDGFYVKFEIEQDKSRLFQKVLMGEKEFRSLDPDKSKFYGQVNLTFNGDGGLRKVENSSWDYTLVEVDPES